ncbi:MAG TPA: RNA 3'-terminal phosphate cyclase [Thermoplasmata archaeon]|nr:RNA 3'-terminal phosphate cyclase [Thermoplasmata archaeon]
MIEIDGSHGEGGGQLLRIAVALSAVTHRPVTVNRIREGRPNPGLAAQHVTALHAVAELASAQVSGLEVGSSRVVFEPGELRGGDHAFDVGTAGSVTLVLQACLPVAFAANEATRLRIVGGTDVQWSPPLDYFARVFLPLIRRVGGQADLLSHRRGYYPRGGGEVEIVVQPTAVWSPLVISDAGAVEHVRGIAHASNLPADIPRRMKQAATRGLHGISDVKIEERVYPGEDAVGQGGAVVLWVEREHALLGASALAERGKSSERVGEEAAAALEAEIHVNATVDIHAADQVVAYLALADRASSFLVREVSPHLRTMAWLIPQFLGRTIEFQSIGDLTRVKVSGPSA